MLALRSAGGHGRAGKRIIEEVGASEVHPQVSNAGGLRSRAPGARHAGTGGSCRRGCRIRRHRVHRAPAPSAKWLVSHGHLSFDPLTALDHRGGHGMPQLGVEALGVDFDERNDLLGECAEVLNRCGWNRSTATQAGHSRRRSRTPPPGTRPSWTPPVDLPKRLLDRLSAARLRRGAHARRRICVRRRSHLGVPHQPAVN